MINSIQKIVKLQIQRASLRRKGIIISHRSTFENVVFTGTALIESDCTLVGDPLITMGNNFYLNSGCHLLGDITMGKDVQIGPGTVIWGRDHGMAKNDTPMANQPYTKLPIIFEDDVWIGANVTILKGVHLQKGVVIGAGSVVTKDIPEYGIAVGNPAQVIKYRE